MNIDVYNTHIEISPYEKGDYPIIENWYTAVDKFSGENIDCGYLIHDKVLYLPRGTSISRLEYITGCVAKTKNKSDKSSKMSKEYISYYELRNNIQEESVKFLTTEGNHQLGLNLATGFGKTFCVAYSTMKLNEKTLIITPNNGLKMQWIKTYSTMFNFDKSKLMNIEGSAIMSAIVDGTLEEADVYFVNHQTLKSYLSQNNSYMLQKFFKKLNIGIKVYDEAHMEFSSIILMDFFSNTNRTFYLTATFDRSDPTQSVCFKRAFNNVISYGEIESKSLIEKHVVYHVVNINSRITPKLRAKAVPFNGMSSVSYGKYAFVLDEKSTAYHAIRILVDKVKDLDGKILIFVPLIEAVDDVVRKLKIDFPTKSIAAFHSKISRDEKEAAEKKDIIVSTIKSMGTGRDIKELRVVISAEPYASKVVAEQVIGRLRPYENKLTYFFDIVDISITPINWWFKGRFKKIQSLVKEIVYLNLD